MSNESVYLLHKPSQNSAIVEYPWASPPNLT